MMTDPPANLDLEAQALAQCYALLIRKAQERRARLAKEQAAVSDEMTTVNGDEKPEEMV
ncbi:MAG: hypothetical protein H6662_16235 [Ardenticatenaceae bacterium]|nr:hypothetical protein [Anaerolineales bacterium]MCB8923136.1 hypothetical protein [Ardenticatenaceae bacterium]MCB9005215.1 hypothetical protein [Ardenticatenaceae bacterium]